MTVAVVCRSDWEFSTTKLEVQSTKNKVLSYISKRCNCFDSGSSRRLVFHFRSELSILAPPGLQSTVLKPLAHKRLLGYVVAVVVIATATAVLKVFGNHINPTTVALALLLIVLFVAAAWGSKPAVLAALLAVGCFNFFYLPPIGKFTIAAPENWIALFAFLVTAMTAGQLSARARRRAEEANGARQEIERLYHELQDSFERSSQAKALKQSERLKSALLDAVTHDLRTPLTSIKASVTMLLNDQVGDGRDATATAIEPARRNYNGGHETSRAPHTRPPH